VRLASRLIVATMVPVLVALCLEVYLVGRVIALTPRLSAATAGILFVVVAGFWFVFPFSMRRLRDGK
jgi:hypothetical protein